MTRTLLFTASMLVTISSAASAYITSESNSGDFQVWSATEINSVVFGNSELPDVGPAVEWNYTCQIDRVLDESTNQDVRDFQHEPNPYSFIYNGEGDWIRAYALGGVEMSIGGFKTLYGAIDTRTYNDLDPASPLIEDPDFTFEYIVGPGQVRARLISDGDDDTSVNHVLEMGDITGGTRLDDLFYHRTDYGLSRFTVSNTEEDMLPDISDELDEPGVFGSRDNYPDKVHVSFEIMSVIASRTVQEFWDAGYGIRFRNYVQCADRAQ